MTLLDETVKDLKAKGIDGNTINSWISEIDTALKDSESKGQIADAIRNMIPIILDPDGRKEIEAFIRKVLEIDHKIHLDRLIEPIEPFLISKLPDELREGYEKEYEEREDIEPKRTLAEITDTPKRDLMREIKDLLSDGWGQVQISEKMNIHEKTLSSMIGEIREEDRRMKEEIREEEKRIDNTPIWKLSWERITQKIRRTIAG